MHRPSRIGGGTPTPGESRYDRSAFQIHVKYGDVRNHPLPTDTLGPMHVASIIMTCFLNLNENLDLIIRQTLQGK
jgi:hypothetical protein